LFFYKSSNAEKLKRKEKINKGETYFTFGKAPVTVDSVRFQMQNAASKKIYKKIVKAKFDFTSGILACHEITFCHRGHRGHRGFFNFIVSGR
jgi:hypothetical protein